MAETALRRDAQRIFRAALAAADPEQAVLRALRRDGETLWAGRRRYDLRRFRRIVVLGCGKAGATMARAVERVLGPRIADSLINTRYGHAVPLRRIALNECGHPVPDAAGVAGAERIAALAAAATADDLILFLISGGGSALLPLPAAPITLAEKQEVTRLLLACGANINEFNCVRKHLSAIKGGQLARLAAPATVISLILSDVVGDPLDVIASGPTVPDASTFFQNEAIFAKYNLHAKLPASVRTRLAAGLAGEVPETPKAGDPAFARTQSLIVGSNRLAVDAAAAAARRLGYRPLVLATTIEGETRDVAWMHAAIAREIRATGRPARPPVCVVSGGETTVTLRGDGLGGRNQEFALAAAIALDGVPGVAAFSAGTDGADGPTGAAGAVADGSTAADARAAGIDPVQFLAGNDSYHFFERVGGLIQTGPTGTNVMDVRLILVRRLAV